MPFDGPIIRQLTAELNVELAQQRIEKIYQPDQDELLLVIRRRKGSSARLVISANSRWNRLHLSSEKRENPSQPSSFCMLLRKYLEGGRILGFEQDAFDRIVKIRIEALNDLFEWQEKILLCEFTGKYSNIVLLDPAGNTIIDGIRRYGSDRSSYREVQPGAPYIPPPSQDKHNPLDVDYQEFCSAFWENNSSQTISHSLFSTFAGLSPRTCEELCSLCGLAPDMMVGECGEYELTRLFDTMQESVNNRNLQPTVVMTGDLPVDYFVFQPGHYDSDSLIGFESMNEALDFYYQKKLAYSRLESMRSNMVRNLRSYLDKAYKKLFFQEGDLVQAQKNEILRTRGELLTAYAYQLTKGQTLVELQNFDGEGTTEIELQPHLTPMQNAQRYFKLYTKARKAREHLAQMIADNRRDIEYLESVVLEIEKAENMAELEDILDELEQEGLIKHRSGKKKQREEAKGPRAFKSADNLDILVGRNNRQNDLLTLKKAGKNDLWLHVQGFAGTHVILSLPSQMESVEDIPDRSLEDAAMLAAYYSKAKEAEKVAIDYTFRYNVRKPRGARPGMVIYDNYWTINVNPSDPRLKELLQGEKN